MKTIQNKNRPSKIILIRLLMFQKGIARINPVTNLD